MKTKQFLMGAACLLMASVSCNQKKDLTPDALAEVHVHVQAPETTKASDITESSFERAVQDLNILLFDATTGKLHHWEQRSNANSFTAKMLPGNVKIFAYANGGNVVTPDAISTLSDLSSLYFNYGDANVSDTKLVMNDLSGKLEMNVVSSTNTNYLNVYLSRIPCRIRLKSITPAFLSETVTSLSYNAAYLQNIPGRISLDGTLDDSAEQRKNVLGQALSAETAEGGALTFKTLTTNSTTNALGSPVALYCFPGSSVYLGFSVKVNGTDYYYALPVSGLQSNKSYDVDVTLHNLGSEDITHPAINTEASVGVTILPWSAGSEITEIL